MKTHLEPRVIKFIFCETLGWLNFKRQGNYKCYLVYGEIEIIKHNYYTFKII